MTNTIRSGATKRRAIAAVVAGASLLTVGGLASSAFFTDSASIDNNDFAFGTVSLTAAGGTAKVFSLPAALPGDSFTGPLTVTNDGTMELRYAAETVVSNDVVGAALGLVIKRDVTDCSKAGFAGSGTQVYTGTLGVAAGHKVVGDFAQGQQTGDVILASGAADNLCVQVNVPKVVDDTFQGQSASTAFNFEAEQTANN